jgi:hypothetical protein
MVPKRLATLHRSILIACFALGAACSKEDITNKTAAPVTSAAAAPSATAVSSAVNPAVALSVAPADPAAVPTALKADDLDVCASPCLLLASVSYEDAGKEYCSRCGKTNPKACDGSWPSKLACGETEMLRNCIYASYGRPFKKKKWQETFGKLAWYKPDATFKDSRLSRVATSNVKKLAGLSCSGTKQHSGEVRALFQSKADGSKEFSHDLDGDGTKETVQATPNKLTIGNASIATKWGENGTVIFLDINKTDKRTEIALVPEIVEDDATYQIYAFDHGAILHLGDVFVGNEPTIRGDGTIVVEKYDCGEKTTETWQLKGDKIVLANTKKSGKYGSEVCAACPYVLSEGADGHLTFRGKIARNLVGAAASDWQSVALPAPKPGMPLRVRIVERESERSSLEEIFVKVDGIRRDPLRGGRAIRLDYGDEVELVFEGPFREDSVIELWAKGYYEPYGDAHPL